MPLHVNVNVVKSQRGVPSVRTGQIKGEYSGDVPKGKTTGVDSSNGTTNQRSLRVLLIQDPSHLAQ